MFDSGVGGLHVLHESWKLSPQHDYYYFLDYEFAPYGLKTDQQILDRCELIVNQMLESSPDLIVIACNTATAVAIDYLRTKFSVPFVGVEPYINLINKVSLKPSDKVGVLLTELTASSIRFKKLKDKLDPESKVKVMASKLLASLVEKNYWSKTIPEKDVKTELAHFNLGEIDHLILGCTHYEYLQAFLEREYELKCYSTSTHIAKRIQAILGEQMSDKQTKIYFKNKLTDHYKEFHQGDFYEQD
jgi:glutamate racemase